MARLVGLNLTQPSAGHALSNGDLEQSAEKPGALTHPSDPE